MENKTEVQGTIDKIFDNIEISEKFNKREFVLNTGGEYPKEIKMEFRKDKVSLLDAYKVGDSVTASINIDGRKWVNKDGKEMYFVTLVAWKLESSSNEPVATKPESDDLPF